MKKCVFSGTFDPPTTGHKRVIERCLEIFDEVVVAVMINSGKKPRLTAEQRKFLLEKMFSNQPRVRVKIFNGAAVDLLKEENTPFYVRGIRNVIDLDYENADFYANKKLMDNIITIYLPAEQDSLQVSSTLIRNSVLFNKDYKQYIPAEIYQDYIKMTEDKDV